MRRCSCFMIAVNVICFVGCSSDRQVISVEKQTVIIPEVIEDDDGFWEQTDGLTDPDTRRLTAYFKQHPSLAENTIVRGEPLVFTSDDERRRYYGVRPGNEEGAEWFCLEFDGREVSLTEGHGPPFIGG